METGESKIRLVIQTCNLPFVIHRRFTPAASLLLGLPCPRPTGFSACLLNQNCAENVIAYIASHKSNDRKESFSMKKKATYDPEIRNHVITVRMNEEEWSAFQSQRKKLGEMSQSDFIRQAVTTAQIKVTVRLVFDSEKLDQMIAECGKIGSNINQIAKHLNIGNPMEARLMKNLNRGLANLDVIRTTAEKMAGEM